MKNLLLLLSYFIFAHCPPAQSQIEVTDVDCCNCKDSIQIKTYWAKDGTWGLELFPEHHSYYLKWVTDKKLRGIGWIDHSQKSFGHYTETDSTIVLHSWLQEGIRTETQQWIMQFVHEQSLYSKREVYEKLLKENLYFSGLSSLFGETTMPEKTYIFFDTAFKVFSEIRKKMSQPSACGLIPSGFFFNANEIHDSLTILRHFKILTNHSLLKQNDSLISHSSELGYNNTATRNEGNYIKPGCWMYRDAEFASVIMAYYSFCFPLWQ